MEGLPGPRLGAAAAAQSPCPLGASVQQARAPAHGIFPAHSCVLGGGQGAQPFLPPAKIFQAPVTEECKTEAAHGLGQEGAAGLWKPTNSPAWASLGWQETDRRPAPTPTLPQAVSTCQRAPVLSENTEGSLLRALVSTALGPAAAATRGGAQPHLPISPFPLPARTPQPRLFHQPSAATMSSPCSYKIRDNHRMAECPLPSHPRHHACCSVLGQPRTASQGRFQAPKSPQV